MSLSLIWIIAAVMIAFSFTQGAAEAGQTTVSVLIIATVITAITLLVRGTKKATNKVKKALDEHAEASKNRQIIESQLYEQIAKEMASGFLIDGLMAKAVAESNGDKDRARAFYIKYRMKMLQEE